MPKTDPNRAFQLRIPTYNPYGKFEGHIIINAYDDQWGILNHRMRLDVRQGGKTIFQGIEYTVPDDAASDSDTSKRIALYRIFWSCEPHRDRGYLGTLEQRTWLKRNGELLMRVCKERYYG